jgi:hypothetical protein
MKTLLLGLSLLVLLSCSAKELPDGYAPLTEAEVSEALKDALSRAAATSAVRASSHDGYYGNPQLKIGFPDNALKLEETLREKGFGDELDQFLLRLNRSAETAASRARPYFIKEITAMSVDDPFDTLNGEADAATRYLIDNSRDELYQQFEPVVSAALDETQATDAYNQIVERYNALPWVFDVDPDIDEYVSEKAIDGLFVLMAEEEARIRNISAARTTRLMKRVFGSLD